MNPLRLSHAAESLTRAAATLFVVLPKAILAGCLEELGSLRRNPTLLAMLLGLPLLYSTVIAYLYQQDTVTEQPVVVVDLDDSAESRRLTLLLDATQQVRVAGRSGVLDEGFARLRQRKAGALIFIPEDFGLRLRQGETAKLKLWIDSANMLTYGTTYAGVRAITSALNVEYSERAFVARGLTRSAAHSRADSIQIADRRLFHPVGGYGTFLAPGTFVVAFQQTILLAFALSVGGGRMRTGTSPWQPRRPYARLSGRFMAHLPFHLLSGALIVWGVFPAFDYPLQNPLGLFLVLTAFAITMGPVALLAALAFSNEKGPLQVLMLVSTPLFLASGFTWPLSLMPPWVQTLARLAPATPALDAVRILTMKTASLDAVAQPLAHLVALFCGYVALGWLVVRVLAALSGLWSRERGLLCKHRSSRPIDSPPTIVHRRPEIERSRLLGR